jgi:hypothetical protein
MMNKVQKPSISKEFLGLAPTMILTVVFAMYVYVNTFLLSDELPQKIIYVIRV